MKSKPLCQFGQVTGVQCPNHSSVKWGDYWFCDDHAGDRKKKAPNPMKLKTLVILSGGLDSTVLAYFMAARPDRELIGCVTVNYGQRHAREINRAADTCKKLNVPHYLVDMGGFRQHIGSSSLTSDSIDIPHGHYAEENMKSTVVPNRNMILAALAVGIAISKGADIVAYGAHAGDHAVYPDCRPEFAEALEDVVKLCDYKPPQFSRPFIDITKADIVEIGREHGVPFEDTWTCYEGDTIACGRCGTCVERLEAFHLAQAVDPLVYKDREFWQSAVREAATKAHPSL